MSHEPPKPTVRIPIVREDEEEHISEDQRPLYRLVKRSVQQNDEKMQADRAIELQKAQAAAAMEASHNARYNAILAAVQQQGKDIRHEFKKETSRLWERVNVIDEVANDALEASGRNARGIEDLSGRVVTLEMQKAQDHRRKEFMAAVAPGAVPPWDLGKASDTGSHMIIPIAEAEASKVVWEKKFDDWNLAKADRENSAKWTATMKWGIGIVGAVCATVLAANIVQWTTAPKPQAPPIAAPQTTKGP
jgi:hypothetical protein